MNPNQVIKAIKSYSTFLITSHISLEGDALGSELALASLLRKLGKTAYIVNSGKTPSNYSFLPGVKKISRRFSNRAHQAVFIIDCSDRGRAGRIAGLIDARKPVINIDHHIGNKNFGKINWVDPAASSTGEMIYRLFRFTRTKLDKKDALNIYTAILTDTGSFRHPNTTSNTLYICSRLLKFGINPAEIYARIYENNSVRDAIYVAKIISRLSFAADNRIAWIKIKRPEFEEVKGKPELLDKILDFAKSIKIVKVVLIFCQVDKRFIKLNLRSKSPIDVQKIASSFGGGGHRLASGCTIKGSLKEAEQMVLRQVKRALKWTVS
ncbi:MAG: bifunctional oligoribonuclease/PAP phosphatase NrnA [Candidatus Omnitrophica bacterium]|nr:bifunctional oligoribonuclease/PAP phosphatase NrnA [Candidatus Omnitrophota bacterium]